MRHLLGAIFVRVEQIFAGDGKGGHVNQFLFIYFFIPLAAAALLLAMVKLKSLLLKFMQVLAYKNKTEDVCVRGRCYVMLLC